MIKTSISIPVYNEIKFIERTLQSVVGEADQIVLCDNASTDGTSEICQEFAQKYPEIEYTRHNENIGACNNFLYALEHAKGEYVRFVGGHDMISRNSTKSMLATFEKNPDAAMVFSKNTVKLNSDYSYHGIYLAKEFGNDLLSDSPFERVACIAQKLSNCSMYQGLYKTNVLKAVFKEYNVFEKIKVDHVQLANIASRGKIIADENSTFYRMYKEINPNLSMVDIYRRIIKAVKGISDDNLVNPYEWVLGIICGTYELAKDMQKLPDAPRDFSKSILNGLINRMGAPEGFEITLDNISILPGKENLTNEVYNEIIMNVKKLRRTQKWKKVKTFMKRHPLFMFRKKFYDLIK